MSFVSITYAFQQWQNFENTSQSYGEFEGGDSTFFYRHSLVKIEQASKIKLKSKYLNKDKKIHQRTFVRHFNEMRIVTKILMFL